MTYQQRKVPERIVCLTEEPTELLYLLGQSHRIVGISAYTVRPEEAKEHHPVVSAFVGGSVKRIAALKPDLIIGFSDIQAKLAHDLIKAGLPVLIFNQRSVQDILDMITMVGQLVDCAEQTSALVQHYIARLDAAKARTQAQDVCPRVYFEEWPDPLICSIEWVGELIEVAGGTNVFATQSKGSMASERFVTHEQIIESQPDLILASWCGKPVDIDAICRRDGYETIPAIQHDRIHELDPAIILQPGPASLSAGLDMLESLIRPVAMSLA